MSDDWGMYSRYHWFRSNRVSCVKVANWLGTHTSHTMDNRLAVASSLDASVKQWHTEPILPTRWTTGWPWPPHWTLLSNNGTLLLITMDMYSRYHWFRSNRVSCVKVANWLGTHTSHTMDNRLAVASSLDASVKQWHTVTYHYGHVFTILLVQVEQSQLCEGGQLVRNPYFPHDGQQAGRGLLTGRFCQTMAHCYLSLWTCIHDTTGSGRTESVV
ncbi:hypothetical protein J6590_069202 [Homalodisca vitripennis]|nr:hypothetical protein J6590_069202 [Homalodisca vitripennis]